MISIDLKAKISDAGISHELNWGETDNQTLGSLNYMSPEMITGQHYGKPSDIWSLGCLLYEICTMYPCFTGSHNQLKERIIDPNYLPN